FRRAGRKRRVRSPTRPAARRARYACRYANSSTPPTSRASALAATGKGSRSTRRVARRAQLLGWRGSVEGSSYKLQYRLRWKADFSTRRTPLAEVMRKFRTRALRDETKMTPPSQDAHTRHFFRHLDDASALRGNPFARKFFEGDPLDEL